MTNALEIKKKTPWEGGNATYHEIRNMNFEYKRGERKKGKEFINSKDSKKKKKERIQRWAKKNFESEINSRRDRGISIGVGRQHK